MRAIYQCIFARIYQARSMESITSLKPAVERALFVKPIQEKFAENSKYSVEIAESFWKEQSSKEIDVVSCIRKFRAQQYQFKLK